MKHYQRLRGVSHATVIDWLENLNESKASGDPRYTFQTKKYLYEVGGFTSPILDAILTDLSNNYGRSTVHRIANEVGFSVKIPGAMQFVTIEKMDSNHWIKDYYAECRARDNAAFIIDESGQASYVYYSEDN